MSPRRAKAVRGRAGDDPATALREHLIEVADKLLNERQIAAITTRDIARTAGVSDGVLYNYFADKHELVLTALVRRFDRLVSGFEADLPEPGSSTVQANLLRYAQALLDLHIQVLPMAAGLLNEPVLLHRLVAEIHRPPGPQRFQYLMREYLLGERRVGRLPAVDVDAATTLLIGATAVLAISSLTGQRRPDELTGWLPGIVTTLVYGLNASPRAQREAQREAQHEAQREAQREAQSEPDTGDPGGG